MLAAILTYSSIIVTQVARVPVHGVAERIVEGALIQAREGATYTTGYFRIGYPNGDIDRSKGVCTDVVIRSLRYAGYDLQALIHRDMQDRFSTYPRREKGPDSNIDHRRCPNQAWFFRTYGKTLLTKANSASWKPGDIVYWKLDNGLDHTGVLTNRIDDRGFPWVVHNLGRCAEEDVLTKWKIVGHYRYPK
jgi:uncharacterized protein YijF (DUF1287 family)